MAIPIFLLTAFSAIAYVLNAIASSLRSPLRRIPGPWHSQITHLVLKYHITLGRRVHYIDSLHAHYGPIVRIAPDEVAVSDITAFSRIHKMGSGFLKSSWYDTITPDREPGIFVMRNPKHHAARRKLFARPFSNSSLETNWGVEIRQKVALAVSRIQNDALNGHADILKWWTLMATDIIAHLSFGESFRMLEQGKQTEYITAIQSSLLGAVLRSEISWLLPILRCVPSRRLNEIFDAERIVFEYGARAVENMRKSGGGTQNLFSQMAAQAEAGEEAEITDTSVRTEAGNLIIAGSDTTAVTLTYLVWAVLKQPKLQEDLEREINRLSSDLTLEELKAAPLINSVIKETLRLYGAAPGSLPRVVPEGGATLCGHFLPAGTIVSTQAYTFHRNPDAFQNPHQFDGYRFIDESLLKADAGSAFSPFGAGARICIGLHLAWMEMRLAVALFFRECHGVRLSPKMSDAMMEMDNRFLISPKGHCCIIDLSDRK